MASYIVIDFQCVIISHDWPQRLEKQVIATYFIFRYSYRHYGSLDKTSYVKLHEWINNKW